MKNFEKRNREFLNIGEGLAAIQWQIVSYTSPETNSLCSIEAAIDISDCSRKVSLDFYIYASDNTNLTKEINNLKQKIKKLKNNIDTFSAILESKLQELENIQKNKTQ